MLALLNPAVSAVRTGVPVTAPRLVVAVIEATPGFAASAPPTAAQELGVTFTGNERDAPGLALAEPDGGVAMVVSTPLRVYATKAPEDAAPDNLPEIL